MMMVPGIPDVDKLWMLSIASFLVLIPLLVGAWKFSSTDAPLTSWPMGPLVSMALLLELAICIWGFIEVLWKPR